LASAAPLLPPGNSAASQYAQTLPGAGGNEVTNGGRHKDVPPAKALGSATAAQLRKLGPAGQAAAQLAADTAPHPIKGRGQHRFGMAAGSGGSSGLSEVLGQITGASTSGGMGIFQPLLILLVLIGAFAFALTRRRTAPPHG
jgi:hypothetical protein